MSALTALRYAVLGFMIVLPAFALQPPTQADSPAEPVQTSPPQPSDDKPASRQKPATRRSPDTVTPSERIKADSAVSFPVDI